jgi:mono/diheme cytochrome c family protein
MHLFFGKSLLQKHDWAIPAALVGIAASSGLGILGLAGTADPAYVDTFPFPITRAVLEHGRNRYTIYCSVCHDNLGTGKGKIVERGYTPPPSYHIPRLREAPVGRFFDVVTNGYGSMPDYKQQIPPRDRWAIVAYIRALQLSQHFPTGEVSEEMRRKWNQQARATVEGVTPR